MDKNNIQAKAILKKKNTFEKFLLLYLNFLII